MNRRARLLAVSALAAATAAVVAFVALLPKEPSPAPEPAPPRTRVQATPESEAARTPTAAAPPASTATPAAPRPLAATATVPAFYRRAAAGDFAQAWSLAGPAMRRAFGNSLARFRRDMSSLRRIRFERVAITDRDDAGVTVEIESVATHDGRVDRCSGTLRAIRGDGGRWLVEPAGVRCTST